MAAETPSIKLRERNRIRAAGEREKVSADFQGSVWGPWLTGGGAANLVQEESVLSLFSINHPFPTSSSRWSIAPIPHGSTS